MAILQWQLSHYLRSTNLPWPNEIFVLLEEHCLPMLRCITQNSSLAKASFILRWLQRCQALRSSHSNQQAGQSVTAHITLYFQKYSQQDLALYFTCEGVSMCAANFAGFQLTNVLIEKCYAVFSGGALHTEAAITIAPCTGVQMINNAATSFGGAFTSFAGSNLFFTQSEFSDNVSGFYGGGLLALYGNATVTYSKINRNRYSLSGMNSFAQIRFCRSVMSSNWSCRKRHGALTLYVTSILTHLLQ